MKALIFTLALVPSLAVAHPHATVEQQLGFSLGRAQSELSWFIVPSALNGAQIFDHIDANGDGAVDSAEQTAFATDLMADTDLTVDGAQVALTLVDVVMPDPVAVLSGQAVIKVSATADMPLPVDRGGDVTLRVDYDAFAGEWYIQPYLHADLTAGDSAPAVIRQDGAVTITVPQVGS